MPKKVKIKYDISSRLFTNNDYVNIDKPTEFHLTVSPARRNPNFKYYNNAFKNSGIFKEVVTHELMSHGQRRTKHIRNSIYKIKINDTICAIDANDVSPIDNNFIKNNNELFRDIKFYFILQYTLKKKSLFSKIENKFGFKILPLTYGVDNQFPISLFKWSNKQKHDYLANAAFTVAKNRKHRAAWVRQAKRSNGFYTKFIKDKHEYARQLEKCSWGLSIRGAHETYDGKCYREAEFLSLGMPLALNYIPCYPFPFYPNWHYVYLSSPNDLSILKEIDPAPYAERSDILWKKYFSPQGVSSLLLNLVFNEEYRNNIDNVWRQFCKKPNGQIRERAIKPDKCQIKINFKK
ncbi:MAG: hypothetical protein ACOC56_06980 [Atribacterota bacterium]